MAKTGTIYGTASKGWQLKVDYSYTQNIANNTSSVTLTLWVYNNNYAYNGSNDAYFTLQGTKTNYTFNYPSTKDWRKLTEATYTVNHNADGTKIYSVTANWHSGITSSYTPADLTLSGSITLDTIPRASTLNTSNLQSTNNKIGSAIIIGFTAAASTFTHRLKYKMSGQSAETQIVQTIAAGTNTYSWTIPTSFYSLCKNSSSLTGTLYLYTFSGSTQVGSNSAAFKCFVDETNNKPTVTLSLSEQNSTVQALTGFNGTSNLNVVKGYGVVRVEVSASGSNQATISSRKLTANGTTANYTVAKQFTPSSYNAISATAVDSRGFTNTASKTLTIKQYFKPTVSINATLTLNPNDTAKATATVTLKGTAFKASFGSVTNSVTVKYRYAEQGATMGSYTTQAVTFSSNNYSKSFTISNLEANKNYQFQAQIVDSLETVTSGTITVTALPIFDMSKTNFNFNVPVSITKPASGEINELIIQNNNKKMALHLSASDNYGIYDYTNGNWLIRRDGSTGKASIAGGLSAALNPYSAGDTQSYTSGYVEYCGHITNGGKDLIFTVPSKSMRSFANVDLSLTKCVLTVRGANGYLKNSAGLTLNAESTNNYDWKDLATITKWGDYAFYVQIQQGELFQNITEKNSVVSVVLKDFTVAFT